MKLKIIDNGVVKKIEYDDKYFKGIFAVTDKRKVKRNCKTLKIDIEESSNPLQLSQKVSKFKKTGILTIHILNEYHQYIIKDYAEKEDVDSLANDLPKESREAFLAASNLSKINDLEKLGFLGDILDNQN